jgi:hypothetical protein
MHPTANTPALIILQWLGAAGDAGRYASYSTGRVKELTGMYLSLLLVVLSASSLSLGQVRNVPFTQLLKPPFVAKVLRGMPPQIKRSTNIPVLLPSMLPSKWARYKLYSFSESEANVWKIFVGTEPHCGYNACSVGYLEAKRGEEPPAPDEVDKVVELTEGIKGYYTGKSCGGSCTPPQIEWVSDGILYTIQFRVEGKSEIEDEAEIVRMAKSAIAAGPR